MLLQAKYNDLVKIDPKWGTISINGTMQELLPETEYKMDLEYEKKGQYDNYKVLKIYPTQKGTDLESTIKFLNFVTSENRAKEIVRCCPDIIDRVLNNQEIDTSQMRGVGEKAINEIKRKIVEHYQLSELVAEYSDYGMTMTMMYNLYNKYPSVEIIKKRMEEDAYHCLCSINNVGFKTADKFIMAKYPHKINSEMRAKACMEFILKENQLKGHSWIDSKEFLTKFNELAAEAKQHVVKLIKEDDEIFYDSVNKRISLTKTRMCEVEIKNRIEKLLNYKGNVWDIDWSKYNVVGDIPLIDDQMKTLYNVCHHNISILAGVGGSGKSFSMQALINMLEDNLITYLPLSSTGKASQVLSEYIGREVKTIHRGLEYNPSYGFKYGEGTYTYNKEVHHRQKLPFDIVIVDEFSMIDIFLLRDLLRAIDHTKTKILFIGDPAQIPSVGVGNIAFDMLQSNVIPTALLTQVFRYGEGGLSYVATQIREGNKYLDKAKNVQTFGTKEDYRFINVDQESAIRYVELLYNAQLKKGRTVNDIMVLTALNKGNYGTAMLNKVIQQLANPNGESITIKKGEDEVTFRVNDKIMQLKNNYKAENTDGKEVAVFNGETGIVTAVSQDSVTVRINNETICIPKDNVIKEIDLAYAISIHKSQGSAAKHVILFTPPAHTFFLDRNILYVAASRSKETLDHIGSISVIGSALRKSANVSRNTFLRDLLQTLK